MKKVIRKQSRVSREMLTNPFLNETLQERLVHSKAIDYKENSSVENLGNGYARISPIDETKIVRL